MAGISRTAPEDRGGSTSRGDRPDPATEAFLAHRNLLFTVAYDGLITGLYAVRNPEKLSHLERETALRR